MRRKKVLLATNPPWIYTGLAESGKFLAQWLARTGKYDLTYYCSQSSVGDSNHSRQPWKSRGCIPTDPQIISQLNQDPLRARTASYGGFLIDSVVKEEKPDILWCSDDIWAFGGEFFKAPWWSQIHSILHVTVDSVPILEQAYEQAKSTPYFYSWAKFAADKMRERGPDYAHVKHIYGATDVNNFSPLSASERLALRKRFGIDPQTTIIGYTFRNQLRKEALQLLVAIADIKRENPKTNLKLHLHTSWSETAAGWDFPKWMKELGLAKEDVLCTYVCRHCGGWYVGAYEGEDHDCPICGSKKTMVTANINHGVPGHEMKYVYGVRDATISPSTSGGLEYELVNTLLCGLPLAATDYASGHDFCEHPFVSPIKWHFRGEAGTSFMKATNDVESIKAFMRRVTSMSDREKARIAEQGRDWAVKTFSIETIGAKWESLFDSLPPKDWSSINLTAKPKNPNFPMPTIADDQQWVTSLYNNILMVNPDPDGLKHWLNTLKQGTSREQVYGYFVKVATEDNAKAQPPQDFWSFLDHKNGRKRAIFVIKESIGDCIMVSALFRSFHEQYPGHDLYVATEPKHFEVFAGNPYIHRLLPYQPQMEQELLMTGAGSGEEPFFHVFFHPAIGSQRVLSYLSNHNVAHKLEIA